VLLVKLFIRLHEKVLLAHYRSAAFRTERLLVQVQEEAFLAEESFALRAL